MDQTLLAVVLLVLHNVDGDEITVNPDHIVTLIPSHEHRKGTPNELIAKGIKCVVGLANGKFVSVVESCATIRQSMQQEEKRKQ